MTKAKPLRISLLGGLCNEPSRWHRYQRYYVMGLRQQGVRVQYADPLERGLAWGWERGWPQAMQTWTYMADRQADRRYREANHVGRYLLHFQQRAEPLRVAIDHFDAPNIRDPQAHDWAEIYFKVNRWPQIDYGPKVRGLVVGNGYLDQARLTRFLSLRDCPKQRDLVLIAKLWPGVPGPTFWHPVEHLVRVFETLAKLKTRSLLQAIVPRLIGHELPRTYLDRLSSCGVQVTQTHAPGDELWTAISTARLNFLRPGRFLCMSWRMIDHLAMGACTVFDRAPYPQWPVPLQAGREFVDCACGIGTDESLPEKPDYERIADTVMALLADPERTAQIGRTAADYFDRHVAPEQVARYFIATAERSLSLPEQIIPDMLANTADSC